MHTVGKHLLIDLVNLDRSVCLNAKDWINAFVKSVEGLEIQIISRHYHSFKPPSAPGITAYILLDSSHFSVHTYADKGEAAIDLFVCKDIDIKRVFAVVCDILGIEKTNISMLKQIRRFNNVQ